MPFQGGAWVRLPALLLVTLGAWAVFPLPAFAAASLMISGNEGKLDLVTGAIRRIVPEHADSLTVLDFTTVPPRVTQVPEVSNTVIGPPSNIAIAPGGRLALVADSIRLDPANATNWLPATRIHVVDLHGSQPRLVGEVRAGLQPSGISFSPDGRVALVANRAAGSIHVLRLRGLQVDAVAEVAVCAAADQISDVAISPDGKRVLASVQKGGYLAVLELEGERLVPTPRKVSVYGQPYRVVITPDGERGLTAGAGAGVGQALDRDALTVVDLRRGAVRAVDHVTLGAVPESIEVSPDGRLVAAVLMEGSNLPSTHADHARNGRLVVLERHGDTYRRVSEHDCGRIPEGVAFTSDGRHLVVQAHADGELRIFSVRGRRVRDTGHRVRVPGFPSSLRASP